MYDRILYSVELGYVKSKHIVGLLNKFSKTGRELLEVGNEITFNDIEKLLRREKESIDKKGGIKRIAAIVTDEKGDKVMVVSPHELKTNPEFWRRIAESGGARIADPKEYPLIRGTLDEDALAEKYPTIRWNFEWGYVVVGVPDGITREFVYEFKSARNRFLAHYYKPVAFTQADLYGYFFRRSRKRV